jgi:hypothetical protein
MEIVRREQTNDRTPQAPPSQRVPDDVRRRVALAHRRAQRLLVEAEALVREQQELESHLVALGAVEGEDSWQSLRELIGLAALDSVLGNAAADISAPGGGLWCGGAPRPWPATGWQLDDEPPGPRRA